MYGRKCRRMHDLQEKPWNNVKSRVLAFYKSTEVLEIRCDSSQSGLEAAVMQNEHPIAYTFFIAVIGLELRLRFIESSKKNYLQ